MSASKVSWVGFFADLRKDKNAKKAIKTGKKSA
jgi:hypothetical protein